MVASEAEWVEEFQDITDEDVEATFSRQHDFWNKLEDEWREMAEKNKETGEHPWLDDFEEVCKYTLSSKSIRLRQIESFYSFLLGVFRLELKLYICNSIS